MWAIGDETPIELPALAPPMSETLASKLAHWAGAKNLGLTEWELVLNSYLPAGWRVEFRRSDWQDTVEMFVSWRPSTDCLNNGNVWYSRGQISGMQLARQRHDVNSMSEFLFSLLREHMKQIQDAARVGGVDVSI